LYTPPYWQRNKEEAGAGRRSVRAGELKVAAVSLEYCFNIISAAQLDCTMLAVLFILSLSVIIRASDATPPAAAAAKLASIIADYVAFPG